MILKAPVASHSDAKLMPEICFFSRGFLGENRKYPNTAIKRVVQYTDITRLRSVTNYVHATKCLPTQDMSRTLAYLGFLDAVGDHRTPCDTYTKRLKS